MALVAGVNPNPGVREDRTCFMGHRYRKEFNRGADKLIFPPPSA
jgi:hypothetical protein